MNERTIILVRHSTPTVDETTPAAMWPLSDDGARKAEELAAALRVYQPGRVVTSSELKAIETGQAITRHLGVDLSIDISLNEQGLGSVPYVVDRAVFLSHVRDHFRSSDQAILGNESASSAADRFTNAVGRHMRVGNAPVVLVSHGRILASYLARLTGEDPWLLWQSFTMPDAFVMRVDPPGHIDPITRVTVGAPQPRSC